MEAREEGTPWGPGAPRSSRLFCRGDVKSFWALFADNLANMIIIAGVMTGVFGLPNEIVFGRVLPGLGVALIAGLGFYAWQARRLARREGRDDVTALPYGISTPVTHPDLRGAGHYGPGLHGQSQGAWHGRGPRHDPPCE